MSAIRTPSALDRLAEAYLDALVALDPIEATSIGVTGHDTELPDLSPDGLAEVSALRRRTLTQLTGVTPLDATDRVTSAALHEELTSAEALRETGAEESLLDNISCPVQAVREVFDLMPTETEADWANVAARMTAVPGALTGYTASLRLAAGRGQVSAIRQVRAAAAQCERNTGRDGFFAARAASAPPTLPTALHAELARGALAAADGYATLARFLREELAGAARAEDAVGAELYPLYSRRFLGTGIDIAETYEWGQAELARIDAELRATADRIRPGATVGEAMAVLDADPARVLTSRGALVEWMQRTADEAVTALAGPHFDIPDPVRRIECRIAPSGTGIIYYTPPNDDFSRPGRMWWSVPAGEESFHSWRERTTVYHEGVPGHHLQCGQTVYRRDTLNRWRRLGSWISGHGEGWALYAERLMAELGFLDDPGDYLGMLDGQAMRAARVVLDIGVHCRLEAPAEVGGGAWSYEKAWEFFSAHCAMSEPVRRFELERYLGWPGQAPSYKIGERMWLRLREDARARALAAGEPFDLAAFHRAALDVGSVGLDVLRAAVLGEVLGEVLGQV